jgi:hypothetical protein
MNTHERELLYFSMEKLKALTGADARDLSLLATNDYNPDYRDGTIEIKMGKHLDRFDVVLKNQVRDAIPSYLLQPGYKWNKNGTLLVSRYIAKPLKEQLKEHQINYLEAAGNCFIKTDNIYIYINDQPVTDVRLPADGKLWKTAGIKFLFSILSDPELLNQNYRAIASASTIALGNIGPLMTELQKEGYVREGVREKAKFLFIDKKDQLIRRWAEAYRGTLRPKLQLYTYRFAQKERAATWKDQPVEGFYWGGESGAALLTGFLSPEKFTIYTNQHRTEVMQRLRLVPDDQGPVEILQQFWRDDLPGRADHLVASVPPLLIYADLITTLDSRNQEAAKRIKAEFLD